VSEADGAVRTQRGSPNTLLGPVRLIAARRFDDRDDRRRPIWSRGMGIETHERSPGTAEVVIDVPPVNALDVASWFALADAVLAAGAIPSVRVVVVRAEGRGFCAGVDIKEIQAKGDEALVGVNRGCAAAFAAVYDCEVPVIAAVQGFCLGGGIGIAGNADIVVASDDATFGLPEVDRGALGAATHLARLVPQHRMRSMVYTAQPATAAELHHYGSVLRVVAKDKLVDTAYEVAESIASKSPTIIRRAKESLNGIDPVDVKRSYRFEQGFTYELHVSGVADEQRQAFVDKREADTST
jgi:enoyl-CoA hydratase